MIVPASATPYPSWPVRLVSRMAITPRMNPTITSGPQQATPAIDVTSEAIALPFVPGVLTC